MKVKDLLKKDLPWLGLVVRVLLITIGLIILALTALGASKVIIMLLQLVLALGFLALVISRAVIVIKKSRKT